MGQVTDKCVFSESLSIEFLTAPVKLLILEGSMGDLSNQFIIQH